MKQVENFDKIFKMLEENDVYSELIEEVSDSLDNIKIPEDYAEDILTRYHLAFNSLKPRSIPNYDREQLPNMICDETGGLNKYLDIIKEDLQVEIPRDRVKNAFNITLFFQASKYEMDRCEKLGITRPQVYLILIEDLDIEEDLKNKQSYYFEEGNILLRFESE